MNEEFVESPIVEERKYTPYITYGLILINLLVFIVTAYLSGSIFDSNIMVLVYLGAKVNVLIEQGQLYRLVTCMFLHGGIVHLGVNMYALSSIGPFIEEVFGIFFYVLLYFIAGITGSLFSYFFSKSISVGASGAIFGILGATLVFAYKMRNRIGKGFVMNILSVIGINVFFGLSMSNVDNFGHLGGLLGGIIVTYVWMNGKKP